MSVVPASNRVLITGVGAVTPLGLSFKETWSNILKGYSGIKKNEFAEHPYLPCKVAATIPRTDNDFINFNDPINNANPPDAKEFNPSDFLRKSESYYSARCIQYALAAAAEAMRSSGLDQYLEDDKLRGKASIIDRYRIGVAVASGMGGLDALEADHDKLRDGLYRKVSPYSIPNMLVNSACGAISLRYGLNGPNLAQATACAASAHAIQEGYSLIASGLADVVVCGGTESAITPLAVAGFSRCKALATKYNDTPAKSSRPWDKKRCGFVMGEGSAILILESETNAQKRGVSNVYGELIGVASTADAYHVTSLDPAGHHVQKCMQLALEMGKRNTLDREMVANLGYINAHATSTDIGDKTELKAILQTMHHNLGDVNYRLSQTNNDSSGGTEKVENAIHSNLRISGTKSSTGHLLGASGAIEAALTINALKTMTAPPTLNLEIPDDVVPKYVNLVPNEAQALSQNTQYAMSNSFGFGGTNACLLFKKRDSL